MKATPIEVRPTGKEMVMRPVQPTKEATLRSVTPAGTSTWPLVSGVYRQPAEACVTRRSGRLIFV